ncbi:LPS export ABC transporter periplasmic protein LptC [Candidatus Latescibacterota bacterium]
MKIPNKKIANKIVRYLFAAFILIILFAGCEKESSISQVKNIIENEPDQKFIKSRIVITENGVTYAIVEAESVKVFSDTDFTSLEGGILIDFFNREGEYVSTLTAGSGEVWGLYNEVDSLKAIDNVVIVSEENDKRLETASYLNWIASTRYVYAEKNSVVKLISERAVEEGINFVAKDDLSEYSMDNVSGTIEGNDINLPGR